MAKNAPLQQTSASLFDSSILGDRNATQNVDDVVAKRISALAVVAIVVAVVSLLAFVQVFFTVISALAVLLSLGALYSIEKSGGELLGRKLACVALCLSLITAVGGPTRRVVYRVEFERQAGEFCEAWFDAAKKGDVCQIRQMNQPYWQRATIVTHQDEIDFFVRQKQGDEEPHSRMHSFLANPTLLTLHALGDRAHHSFYCTTTTWLTNSTESTERIYAVTVDPAPNEKNLEKQTFFFRLVCNRVYSRTEEGAKLVGWSTIDSDLSPVELDKSGRPIWSQEEM